MKKLKEYAEFVNEMARNKKLITAADEAFMKAFGVRDWKVNPDEMSSYYWKTFRGHMHVSGGLNVNHYDGAEIPIKFIGRVTQLTFSNCNRLVSMKNCPEGVEGNFVIQTAIKLKSLEGSPDSVMEDFIISNCPNLESLKGCPTSVGRMFKIDGCLKLTTLDFGPEEVGRFLTVKNCPLIPKEQLNIINDKTLMDEWLDSGLMISEFIRDRRGHIKGRKFGL